MKKHSTHPASVETRQRIADYIAEYRRIPPFFTSPTLREIAEHLDMSITNVNWHISCMVRDGQLLKSGGHRGLVPLPDTKLIAAYLNYKAKMDEMHAQMPEWWRQESSLEPLEDIHARVKEAVRGGDHE